jgi:CheY-like chemotaxis protein
MMRSDAGHPDPAAAGGRLTLLLTDGGWREESWADRLPRLLEPMGVAALRAGCGREAADLLQSTRVHAAVLDLSLPLDARRRSTRPAGAACSLDEGGVRLLELLARQARAGHRPPLVVVRQPRTMREDQRTLALAMKLGAFAVVDRPVHLERMLQVLHKLLDRHYRGRWPAADSPSPPPPE